MMFNISFTPHTSYSVNATIISVYYEIHICVATEN